MRRIVSVLAGAALVLAMSVAIPSLASASTSTTVVVTSTDLVTGTPSPGQFKVINQGGGGGSVGMVFGPGTPPLGLGSLQLSTTGTTDHWSVYNYDHVGTALSAITALSYSTYTDNTTTAPVVQLEINPGNAGTTGTDSNVTYSTVNFEPYLNSGEQAVAVNTWQTWNVLSGKVWGTHLTGAPMPSPLSWSQFLTTYPNATIKGGFGVNVGSGWSAMTGATDALTIGTSAASTTYDFEPSAGNRPFKSAGAGTETSLSATGCQNTAPYDCVVQSTGTATSSHLGTGPYTSTLTVHWGSVTSNGAGGYCAPADGTGTLTAANGDTLTQVEYGTVCEVGATSPTAPHTFTGYFYDTGGTGRFADAAGGGTLTGGDDGYGNSSYAEAGTISY